MLTRSVTAGLSLKLEKSSLVIKKAHEDKLGVKGHLSFGHSVSKSNKQRLD